MDEPQLYHREAFNDRQYSEDYWAESDDAQFADITDFEDTEDASSLLPQNLSHSVRNDTRKQLQKEGNSFQNSDQDLTNLGVLESELSKPLEEPQNFNYGSKENLRQSDRSRVP